MNVESDIYKATITKLADMNPMLKDALIGAGIGSLFSGGVNLLSGDSIDQLPKKMLIGGLGGALTGGFMGGVTPEAILQHRGQRILRQQADFLNTIADIQKAQASLKLLNKVNNL